MYIEIKLSENILTRRRDKDFLIKIINKPILIVDNNIKLVRF